MSEDGEKRVCSAEKGKLGKKEPEGNPLVLPCSHFSPLSLRCHSFFSLRRVSFLFLFMASLSSVWPFFALCAFLPLTHTRRLRAFKQASAHPAAIRQDSASASISPTRFNLAPSLQATAAQPSASTLRLISDPG